MQVNPYKVSQMVRCPLQGEDRTPSMSINTNTGLWNCHSCGKGGDSYNLIMEKEGVDFRGASNLAASVGFATGDAGGSDQGVRGSSYAGSRKLPGGKGGRKSGGGYVPAWRRR
ncbi:CHC2 zinc finger domain-containing protein [Micromonospora sp. GCM10011541]|uniref:CHC2 zinc finger domain-containing protein n=1 Tax=Micromonospora sp. GCM10011541 TaxID=3317336 RepID=UPI00360713B6